MGLGLCDAESLDVVEAFGGQPVEPDAVGVGVDDLVEVMEEGEECLFIGDDLENGFLDPQAVAFTEFRDAAKAALASWAGGIDVVGEQQVHQAAVQGR